MIAWSEYVIDLRGPCTWIQSPLTTIFSPLLHLVKNYGLTSSLALVTNTVSEGVTIADIQGYGWQSPYSGKVVRNLSGTVTARGPNGLWLAGDPVEDRRVSTGLYVYSPALSRQASIGDEISLSGLVTEYRASNRPSDLFVTELVEPTSLEFLSRNNVVAPLVIGVDRVPPSVSLSALDDAAGIDGWLAVPNNQSLLSAANATLRPELYGLDFWESLEGRLVTIPNPVALNFEDRFGSFWVVGDWDTPGRNARGGLTLSFDTLGLPTANADAILIGRPLDRAKNPAVAVGAKLSNITGVIHYQYGFFSLLPLSAPSVLSAPPYEPPASSLVPDADPCSLIIGDYNVENMSPKSAHLPIVAEHIALNLQAPSIMLLQEIQDDSGSKNDGTVSANVTLTTLVDAIYAASNSTVQYAFTDVPPIDNHDGGQPGGNIRVAYLYRPDKVALVPGPRAGGPTEANAVVADSAGNAVLRFNPGRIEPSSAAWNDARKPLAAHWQTSTGERFFTINVHFSSKRGSTSTHGDPRPPINGAVETRLAQANITAAFVRDLLAIDPQASVILGGDMNEFVHARSVFASFTDTLYDINEVSGVNPVERYTYAYDQNTEELDHLFVSRSIADRGTEVEHVHVNTWAPSKRAQVSDHDPTLSKIRICTNLQRFHGSLGGISPKPVTERHGQYRTDDEVYSSLAAARAASCDAQRKACISYARSHEGVTRLGCIGQEARCLTRVVA
ncbi:DNase I-like protein [Punctularia strigosozonata HHB-11173 SS5]|uniref:DNase I-like protein n=1 Tax=Punctularia strigosozonata (strain HHB-11173) TaxID=741275 RepID=R7S5C9_PUNST|nr:DNase I-like protein [Punctularia strigosozonata HHB-11173 SS5]EIN05174.1 DNase I-like protein [Punctularia strigosozonata HHB-11173 SS5]